MSLHEKSIQTVPISLRHETRLPGVQVLQTATMFAPPSPSPGLIHTGNGIHSARMTTENFDLCTLVIGLVINHMFVHILTLSVCVCVCVCVCGCGCACVHVCVYV